MRVSSRQVVTMVSAALASASAVAGCAAGAPSQASPGEGWDAATTADAERPGPGSGSTADGGSAWPGSGDSYGDAAYGVSEASVADGPGTADVVVGIPAADGGEAGFSCPPGPITAGLATITVGGRQRQLYVDVPSATSQPMAVVFSWHGYNQLSSDFRTAMAFDPNAVPAVPAVIVTPVDTGIQPPFGLDWDIVKGKPADANVDLPFFAAMVGCLEARANVDATRIYSFGFSAGAVMNDLVASRFPGVLAASIAESGAWFNDPAEVALVTIPLPWDWPALDPADRGDVLISHGGPNDVTVLNLLSLENAAAKAVPFLLAAQRTVVDCAHGQGHAIDPDVPDPLLMQYLFAHRLGQPSPFAGGALPADFPASCTLHVP
jgi:poly(3-hydroxybutyrate) depolymerase